MKYIIFAAYAVLLSDALFGATATEELNPELHRIFEKFQADPKDADLAGKEFEVDLTLKVASKKFLIFSDAYLQADEETKYQIGKWEFSPELTADLNAKRGDICRVRFKIDKVRTDPPYSDMPHFTATIVSLAIAEKKVDSGGRINSGSPRSSP